MAESGWIGVQTVRDLRHALVGLDDSVQVCVRNGPFLRVRWSEDWLEADIPEAPGRISVPIEPLLMLVPYTGAAVTALRRSFGNPFADDVEDSNEQKV